MKGLMNYLITYHEECKPDYKWFSTESEMREFVNKRKSKCNNFVVMESLHILDEERVNINN